jgi:DNA-binding beta-propeller fold protein YncE
MRTWLKILAWSLILAACNDPSSGPLDIPEFTVSPAVNWSGGTITITSQYFIDRAIPVLRVDTIAVTVARADDSTVTATLPQLPTGAYPVTITDRDLPGPIAEVQLVGFSNRRDVSPGLNGVLISARALQAPVVLGNTAGDNIAMISPVSGSVTSFPTLFPPGAPYNIAPSYQGSDVFVLRDTSGVVGEWRLWPVPTMLDTVASGFKFQFTRHVVTFAPDIYLITGSHTSTSFSPTGNRFFTTESVWANFLSPAGDRAVIGSNVGQPGTLVMDMTTGDSAFTLPVHATIGAAFSPDGSLLFATGGEYFNTNQLMRVNAATGTVIVHDSLPADTYKNSLALSGSGNRIYVAGERNGRPRLLVYDAATLAMVANLAVADDDSFDCALTCWEGVISLDEPFGRVYFTIPSDLPGVPTRVYGFDILPE